MSADPGIDVSPGLAADSSSVLQPAVAPLVSVLVRSMGRPTLGDTLASAAAQTYPAIEVLVINASGSAHPPLPACCGPHPLRLIDPGRPLRRPQAANAALRAARGEWLLFLDDDDRIDADHLQRLRAALEARPDASVAYAGVRRIAADGRVDGAWDEPFDPLRLWQANYLPIHAVLFARSLVDAGARFDEGLDVYEDWDFWLQLAGRSPFVHVPGTSASYRMLGDSGLGAGHDEARSHQGRQAVYRKWHDRIDADTLERLCASAEHLRGERAAAVQALHAAQGEVQALQQDRARRDAAHAQALAAQAADLAATRRRVEVAEARLRHSEADRKAALAEYARLEQGYRQVTASLSWRVTAPLRRLRAMAAPGGAHRALRAAWRALPLSAGWRQALKVRLTRHAWGVHLLRRLAPAAVPPPVTTPASDVDKEAVRRDAEAALGRFLTGSQRLALPTHGAAPRLSVVIVVYNQAGLTLLALQALAASRGIEFETLIVDNASSDRMPKLLARVDGARVLRQSDNLGFLRAVNAAAAQARGEHLLLLNNDALVEPDTLAAAVARLDRDAGVGAVGGPILLWDGRLQEAGSIVWRDGSCLGYGRGDDPDRPAYAFVRDVDYCSGAFLMLRRSLFERMGRLDEAYAPAYYEESDLCARLWEAGQRVVYDPAVRVRHFEFASAGTTGRAIALQQRHREVFVQRHAAFLSQRPEAGPGQLLQARQRLAPGALRVLVIDDRVPLPWLGQGYPRAARLVATLVQAGHFVTHYPLQFPREARADVARALPETVEVMLDQGLPGLADFLATRRGFYDRVIVSRPHNMAALREQLQRDPDLLRGATIVYDAEALFSLRDIAKAALLGRPLAEAEQRQRIAAEMALARGADRVVAVSEAEAAHYRAAGYPQVHVLGHAIELRPTAAPFESRSGVLFVGALNDDDTPNADSLRWFIDAVWPRVQAALGADVVLRIVGACDAASVRQRAGPTVQLLGPAEDLHAAFDAARVFIVPTRYAAGVPHKAHEAAAQGLPMVVTPLIATQLGWQDVVPVGADAAGFAEACVQLYRDGAAWAAVRQRQLDAVRRDCAPPSFVQAVQALVTGPPGLPSALPSALLSTDRPTGSSADAPATPTVAGPTASSTPQPAGLPPPDGPAAIDVAADLTAQLWGRDARQRLEGTHVARHWSSHPVTAAEINRLVSGDPTIGWVAHLKRAHFVQPGQRGVSLGCGSGAAVVDAVRHDVVLQMEGLDLSADAVAVARERAIAAGVSGRARFRVTDLNRLRLQGPYDLILFEQSLHHVDALDAVLDECRGALAPQGRLVLNEYVGPDRFQWTDEAARLMDALLQCLPERLRRNPDTGTPKDTMRRVTPDEVIAVDPSEAIHSSRILQACAARFVPLELKAFGGTLLQFMLADIAANFDPADDRDVALLRLMTLLETELIRAGALASDFVFAVYRRRDDAPLGP